MKHTIVIIIIALFPNLLPAQETNFALNVGGTSNEFTNDMAVDGNGNTYLIGTTFSQSQTIDFNPLGTASNQTPNDLNNTFLAKYNSSGILQWSMVFDNGIPSLNNFLNGKITVDGNGDVYICVHLDQANVDFNPLGTANVISATGDDFVFAKYNSSGILQWIFQVDANINKNWQMEFTTDASNNLYVLSQLNGTNVNINPLGTSSTLTATNNSYLAKYNSDGIHQWSFVMPNSNRGEYQPALETDNSGNLYVFANLLESGGQTIDVNPLGTPVNFSSTGDLAHLLMKYNSSGINQWAVEIDNINTGVNGDKKFSLVLDSQSDIYIGSTTRPFTTGSTTDINPLGIPVLITEACYGFLAKYNNSGINQWVINYGTGSGDGYITSLAVDATDHIYATLEHQSNVTRNINPLGTATNASAKNIVAKYNSSGILQGHFTFDNMQTQEIKLDNTGNIYFAGFFTDASLDIDPSASTKTLTNNGGADFYLVSYKSTVFTNVLPVSLTAFEAALQDNQTVQLKWQTASEQNNEGFEIQHSIDGRTWENIGFITGNGTTTEVSDYEFIDFQPKDGANYYRLKQIDFDGQFEYSDIVNIELETGNSQPATRIFPNPVTDAFYVENETAIGSLIQVFDIKGELIIEQQHQTTISRIPTDELDNGTYFIKMNNQVRKVIVQK